MPPAVQLLAQSSFSHLFLLPIDNSSPNPRATTLDQIYNHLGLLVTIFSFYLGDFRSVFSTYLDNPT